MVFFNKYRKNSGSLSETLLASATTLTLILASVAVAPAQAAQPSAAAMEKKERNVDGAAMAALDKSMSTLTNMLKKYRGTAKEPIFLQKLAEIQQEKAAILFRIAHGRAASAGGALNLTAYKAELKKSINTLSEIIRKFPDTDGIPQVYYMRGKGYEEIEDVKAATSDYIHLTKNFPEAEESPSAYMSLAEFSIVANDHAKAIVYLNEVEKRPESPHYPFALYKLAWSHYNLKDIPKALSFAERNVEFYNERRRAQENPNELTSDEALRENALLDIPVFHMEGSEQKLSQYQIGEALSYFRKVGLDPISKKAEKSPIIGRMFLKYAKLLRSHGQEADLTLWKNEIMEKEYFRPEALEVVLTTFENQVNKRRYPELMESTKNILTLYEKTEGKYSFAKAHKLILDTAESYQELIVKNKSSTGVVQLSTTLASLYDVFTKIVDEKDPRIPQVHYNLAETLFEIKDYQQATQHYRWVVEHGKWEKEQKTGNVIDSSLKAISSRYEILKKKNLIPTELKATKIVKDAEPKLDPLLAEWITWVDTHVDKTNNPIDNFYFEANRSLYAAGDVENSLKRMIRFVRKYPKSTVALPSASLSLDTYITSQDWENTYELATELQGFQEWKSGDFSKRLFAVAADSFYKQIEILYQAKEYKAAIKKAEKFLKLYSKSERLAECLTIAGGAALALQEKKEARAYYSRLIQEVGAVNASRSPSSTNGSSNSTLISSAYAARAAIAEEQYEFKEATQDLRNYINSPSGSKEKNADALRKKILMMSWLSNDPIEIRGTLQSKNICTEKLQDDCNRYEALELLEATASRRNELKYTAKHAYEQARKGPEENRGVWAALALEDAKEFAFRDRLILIKQVVSHWDEVDPIIRFRLIPLISKHIPTALELNRLGIASIAPLRAEEKYITRRIEAIREIENAITKVMKLPWARIRASALSEIAGLYIDLSVGLAALPAPKGLSDEDKLAYEDMIRKITIPFEEKGNELRAKAFEMASLFAIEDSAFNSITEPYFKANPSQAKAFGNLWAQFNPKSRLNKRKAYKFDLKFLDNLDSDGDWDDVRPDKRNQDTPAEIVKARWAKALQDQSWQQVAFFTQEMGEKKLLKSGSFGLAKAVSLAAAGAQAEALLEIEESKKGLSLSEQLEATELLIGFYKKSYAKERVFELIKGLESTHPADAIELKNDFVPPAPSAAPARQIATEKTTEKKSEAAKK